LRPTPWGRQQYKKARISAGFFVLLGAKYSSTRELIGWMKSSRKLAGAFLEARHPMIHGIL
jgi:hypothetical protein